MTMSAPESTSRSRLAGPQGVGELLAETSQQSAVYTGLAIAAGGIAGFCAFAAEFFRYIRASRKDNQWPVSSIYICRAPVEQQYGTCCCLFC
jgi:hypothetical protein